MRHRKICLKGKKHLANVLDHAKESYHSKKCRTESGTSSSHTVSSKADSHAVGEAPDDATLHSSSVTVITVLPTQITSSDDAHMSGPDKVCVLLFYFITPDIIGAV